MAKYPNAQKLRFLARRKSRHFSQRTTARTPFPATKKLLTTFGDVALSLRSPRLTGSIRYRHFVYNGHSRLMIAREFELPLFGLVAEKDEDIPTAELIGDRLLSGRVRNAVTLDQLFRFILAQKIGPHPTIGLNLLEDYQRSYLVQEFMKWEQGRRDKYT